MGGIKKMKILIVDDSSMTRKDNEESVKSVGGAHHEVISVSNKIEAERKCFEKFDVELIITDMNFPMEKGGKVELAGFEFLNNVAREYNKQGKTFPKVLIYSRYLVSEGKMELFDEAVPKDSIIQEMFPWRLRRRLKEMIEKT